jgi:ketosteroid isomerase-like protein
MCFRAHLKLFAASFVFLMLFFSCSESDKRSIESAASAFDIKQAQASIAQTNLAFMKFFKAGDSAGVANCYTTDAKTMAAHMPAVNGRENITHFISESMAKGLRNFNLSTIKIWGDSNIVAEEGTYNIADSAGKQMDKGKYIALWKQEAGNWKLFRDIWNSDLPDSVLDKKSASPK